MAALLEAAPELAAIHPMDAVAPDEEVMLLSTLHKYGAEAMHIYPILGLALRSRSVGRYAYLYRLLQFLQWQKRQRGLTGNRWLLKTPHHLHYPRALAKLFPQAKVIQTHRHPKDVIPSYSSMMCALAAPFTDQLDKVAMSAHWAKKWQCGLSATLSARTETSLSLQYLDLYFSDLLSDPQGQIARLYDFIGEELTETALTEMAQWQGLNKRESRPEHHYTLAEFGLSEDQITDQFSEYISHYF